MSRVLYFKENKKMKKLALVFSLIALFFISISAQTGNIVDKDNYIQINYPDGDTISYGKTQTTLLKTSGSRVYIMNNQRWGADKLTRIVNLEYDDFGFSSAGDLRDYLSAMIFRTYKLSYSYNGSLIDSISYNIGDSTAFKISYTYSDGLITDKTAPINE